MNALQINYIGLANEQIRNLLEWNLVGVIWIKFSKCNLVFVKIFVKVLINK